MLEITEHHGGEFLLSEQLMGAGSVPEADTFYQSEIAGKTQLPGQTAV